MSVSTSYLSTLYSAISGASDPLLSAIYGQTSGTVSAQTALQTFASDKLNETQDVAATAAQPSVKEAVAQFTAGVNAATSVKQLLANPAWPIRWATPDWPPPR